MVYWRVVYCIPDLALDPCTSIYNEHGLSSIDKCIYMGDDKQAIAVFSFSNVKRYIIICTGHPLSSTADMCTRVTTLILTAAGSTHTVCRHAGI